MFKYKEQSFNKEQTFEQKNTFEQKKRTFEQIKICLNSKDLFKSRFFLVQKYL